MVLSIACSKDVKPSISGTTWSTDNQIGVQFLSATDCSMTFSAITNYHPKYTYTYQHPDIVLILNDEKTSVEYHEYDDRPSDNPLLFIFPKEYQGTINSSFTYMTLRDVKSGNILQFELKRGHIEWH